MRENSIRGEATCEDYRRKEVVKQLWGKVRIVGFFLGTLAKARKNVILFGLTEKRARNYVDEDFSPMILPQKSILMAYPENSFIRYWQSFLFILVLYTAVMLPIHLCFQELYSQNWIICDTVIDVLFFTDIFISFNTAYYDEYYKLITNRHQIAIKYISSWFCIDLLSCFPVQLFAVSMNNGIKIVRVNRLYRVLTLVKFLRFTKASYHTRILLLIKRLDSVTVNFLRFFVIICLMVHILGCTWITISNIEDPDTVNWYIYREMDDKSIPEIYLTAVYFVCSTLSTVGYGDIVPTSIPEKLFTICLMVFGIGFYSVFIGNLSKTFTNIDTKQSLLKSKLAYLHDFKNAISLSENLSNKIKKNIVLNVDRNYFSLNDLKFLDEIPFSLKEKLSNHLYRKCVERIDFFKGKSSDFAILKLFIQRANKLRKFISLVKVEFISDRKEKFLETFLKAHISEK
jgi:hypothetical protein